MLMQKFYAELIGTFVLVFCGIGTAVFGGSAIVGGTFGVAFAFGLGLLAMAYAIGPISGCHINPAVTLGVFLRKGMNAKEAGTYCIAQIIGAVLASGVVLAITKGAKGGYDAAASGLAANGYGAHSPGGFSAGAGFTAELIFTAILVLVVLATTDKLANAAFAGIPIGLTLLLTNLACIQITNASINPARSIGPAVFVGGWALSQLWLFIIAPLAGGVIGWLSYTILFAKSKKAA